MGLGPKYIPSFVEMGLLVLEKTNFEGFYHIWALPRSRNDMDNKYSNTFINAISCRHLPFFHVIGCNNS